MCDDRNIAKTLFEMRQIVRQIRNIAIFHALHCGRHIGIPPGAVTVSEHEGQQHESQISRFPF
jgi:hypothetical protein